MSWELSAAESESTSSQLRLDKRKMKMNNRRSSTDKTKRQKSNDIYLPWFVQIAAGRKRVLLEKVSTWGLDRFYKPY